MSVRRRHAASDLPPPRPPSSASSITRLARALDVYPKTLPEFNEKTDVGGLVSVCAVGLIVALLVSQLSAYFAVRTHEHLSIDVEREQLIRINLNVTFPAIPCAGIGLVTMDVAGEQQIDVLQNLAKTRLSPDGAAIGPDDDPALRARREGLRARARGAGRAPRGRDDAGGGGGAGGAEPERCGQCYEDGAHEALFQATVERTVQQARERLIALPPGASARCCNSCDDVRAAHLRFRLTAGEPPAPVQADWQAHPLCAHDVQLIDPGALNAVHEGCNVVGFLHVNKVAGNFHVAPGRAFSSPQGHLVHEFKPFAMSAYNTSHTIHALSFGPHYPSQVNPLDGVAKVNAEGSALYQYYIKVVPTSFKPLGGAPLATCQYSVTEAKMEIAPEALHQAQARRQFVLPGVFFIYDISPIKVAVTEEETSFWTFVTSLCAIVGGVYVVAGMVDSALHSLVSKRGGASSSSLAL